MKTKIYFDYAATTPVDARVEKAMKPYFSKIFGNPGSVHRFGQEASAAVFEARQKIAKAIGAKYDEIIFTGSATEANNLALRGIVKFWNQELGIRSRELGIKNKKINSLIPNTKFLIPRLIVSAIEHESILETARDLEKEGVEVIYIPVSKEGIVDVKKIKEALNERTVLVSIMYANNEIGTIEPIAEIAQTISEFKSLKLKKDGYPLLHSDAVQALQFLNCNVDDLGIDLMTLSAHKIYGPKGIGALYVRNYELRIKNYGRVNIGIKNEKTLIHNSSFIIPIITGGGQESGLRSGTENVPYVVGFGAAIEIAESLKVSEFKRLSKLRDYFWKNFKKIFPKAELNSSARLTTSGSTQLPNILNIYLPGSSAHDRCIELDLLGIAVSPGVACSARSSKPSYVIEALNLGGDRAHSSLRFSFGKYTTKGEIDQSLKLISKLKKGL